MKRFLLILFIFTGSWAQAQLVIDQTAPYNSVNHLINNVFAGGNVSISNIQSYGTPVQIGFFSGMGTSFGMDSGIVLSCDPLRDLCNTGCNNALQTGNTPNSWTGVNYGPAWFGTTSNNNLLNVSQSVPTLLGQNFPAAGDVNDAAAIWFDFTPTKDTMRFKFVFASNEWDGYPCTTFNDVFGFFVSGPGITGSFNAPTGFTSAQNFAVVPGTNIPITISSITNSNSNSIANCNVPYNSSYYVSNNTAALKAATNLDYNAHTTTMTVEFPVTPCQTYNFCIAIADGSDAFLGSAVFLEANSFEASGITIAAAPAYNTIGGDSIIYEGCGSVDVHFVRHDSVHLGDTIEIGVGGNATNGLDYSFIADSLLYVPGQDSFTVSFQINHDQIIEGNETLYIWVADTTISMGCGNKGDSLMLIIHDPIPLTSNATSDTVMCTANNVVLDANVLTGFPDFSYQWSTGGTDSLDTLLTAPTVTTQYYVTITDACNLDTIVDTSTVVIQNPQTSIYCPDDTITCETVSTVVSVQTSNPMPDMTYQWSTGQTFTAFVVNNPYVTTDYIVTLTQVCAGYNLIDTFTVVVDNPPFTLEVNDDTINCTSPPSMLTVIPSYTTPGFTYQWSTGETTPTIMVNPSNSQQYFVSVTDACGANTVVDTASVIVQEFPMSSYSFDKIVPCAGDSINIGAVVSGGFKPYTYAWSTAPNTWLTDTNVADIIVGSDSIAYYSLSVTDICNRDTIVENIEVEVQTYPPLVISPIDTIFYNCPGETFTLGSVNVYGGSSDYSVSWDNWLTTHDFLYDRVDATKTYTVEATDHCNGDSAFQTFTAVVATHEDLKVTLPEDTVLCPQEPIDLYAVASGGGGNITYRWNNGRQDSVITAIGNGYLTYTVTVTEDCGNTAVAETAIDRYAPEAHFDHIELDAFSVTFTNLSQEADSFLWVFGDGGMSSEKDPWYTYKTPERRVVELIAYNELGCTDTAYAEVNPPLNAFIPNAFTPNGDGLNDVFEIKSEGFKADGSVKNFYIRIYNRWGEEVFYSKDVNFQWDGTLNGEPVGLGNFVYKMQLEGFNRQKIEVNGELTVLSY